MDMKNILQKFSIFILALLLPCQILAEPPYLTDDPTPTDYQQIDAYLFSSLYATSTPITAINTTIPAVEIDYGLLPKLEIHVVVPWENYYQQDAFFASGIGDIELGLKYRLIDETSTRPRVAFAPLFELPTGNGNLNLGNGGYWMKLPLWVQKSWGPWTSYVGGGYIINTAAFGLNYYYGGLVITRSVTEKLRLGAEVYSSGKSFKEESDRENPFDNAEAIVNFGCSYDFTKKLGLRVSSGFAFWGQPQFVSYVGISWSA